ncbi:unnamed protein product [Cylicostephanus goldi]|uniref:Uncharacterized protein n=1 Tax=Cylicostephanus goldi TaxID=71465 RepID=A0A3P6T8G7_CYLGO|nr:unnamed protein product [Cylicostephanus goldi]
MLPERIRKWCGLLFDLELLFQRSCSDVELTAYKVQETLEAKDISGSQEQHTSEQAATTIEPRLAKRSKSL